MRGSGRGAALIAVLLSSCAPQSRAVPASAVTTPSAVAPAPVAAPPPSASSLPTAVGRPCGKVNCRIFETAADAFAPVLAASPRVVGVGEAHALAGTEGVEPATRRFTRDLLPLLRGKASDIVVELLLPNASCRREAEKARQEQKVVTEKQAPADQNDYVALANAARALGIVPHALEPTCDDLARIAAAGRDAVVASLDVVTRLARENLTRLYEQNAARSDPRFVVGYGGAMHNDVDPRPGREQWSFGPELARLTGGRYVEVDLIVPEFISDSPAWQALPWLPFYDAGAHPESVTLLTPKNDSFVIVFARTSSAEGRYSVPSSPGSGGGGG